MNVVQWLFSKKPAVTITDNSQKNEEDLESSEDSNSGESSPKRNPFNAEEYQESQKHLGLLDSLFEQDELLVEAESCKILTPSIFSAGQMEPAPKTKSNFKKFNTPKRSNFNSLKSVAEMVQKPARMYYFDQSPSVKKHVKDRKKMLMAQYDMYIKHKDSYQGKQLDELYGHLEDLRKELT